MDDTGEDLAHRLARFARTRDHSVLWPGLTESRRVAAAQEIERVTRAVLQSLRGVRLDPLEAHAPYAVAIAAHTTGMGPLLGRWVEDKIIEASPAVESALELHLRHSRLRTERIEDGVLPVFDEMIDRGLSPVVLKGFHTAREYFEEPAARRMSDVDLFIPPEELDQAEAALLACGFEISGLELIKHKREWIGPGVENRIVSVEMADERSPWVIEVHTSLDRVFNVGAVARFDSLRDSVVPFVVAGRTLRAQGPVALLLTLAAHCSQELHSARLLRLVEMVRLIRDERDGKRLDWVEVLDMLHRTGAARYTYPAFALIDQLSPGLVDQRVIILGARESTLASRHTVRRLAPAGGSFNELGFLRQVMWTRGLAAIGHRAQRFIWPESYERPGEVLPSWNVRLRQLRAGLLSVRAPDERRY